MAIGCNTKTVKVCPTSFKQMLKPGMGYKIGINNNPTEAAAAFAAVCAAALASGGSFNNIKPGVDYFQKLNKVGNFVADRRRTRNGAERGDEHRHLVGLPAGFGDPSSCPGTPRDGRS